MNSKKRVIFVGSPLPENLVQQYRTLSFNTADNIAQNVMVKGLLNNYGNNLTVISESSEKHPDELDLGYGIKASMISSNGSNKALYYLSLMVNYARKLNEVLKHEDGTHEVVVVTRGSYIFIALPVLIARLKYGVKWVPFIITTVEVPEYGFPYNIVSKMSRWTSKRVDGVIAYVAKTARDYMPGKPSLEIVYSIEDKLIKLYKEHQPKTSKKFTISYTGSLSNTYNFNYVIDAISKTNNRYHWVFAGGGQYADRIKEMALNNKYDIDYLGPISNIEVIRLQKSSNLLICPRGGNPSKTNQYYSKYAASGKLIEYLCSGTPILASDVPSTLDKIKPFMSCEDGQTAEQFIRDIENIEQDYKNKLKIAKKGQQYAFKYFTADYQNKNIYEFLESL